MILSALSAAYYLYSLWSTAPESQREQPLIDRWINDWWSSTVNPDGVQWGHSNADGFDAGQRPPTVADRWSFAGQVADWIEMNGFAKWKYQNAGNFSLWLCGGHFNARLLNSPYYNNPTRLGYIHTGVWTVDLYPCRVSMSVYLGSVWVLDSSL